MPELKFHMKLINTIAFLALLTTAVLVGAFEGYHRISDGGFSFAINLLLYALLGGLSVYKWLPGAPKDAITGALGIWYPLVSTTGVLAYVFWYFDKLITAEIFSFLGLVGLFIIYIKLRKFPPRNTADFLFLNAPFSMWVALTVYTVLFSAIEIFFKAKGERVPAPIPLTMMGIVVAALAVYFLQGGEPRDSVYATTTACILFLLALNDLEGPVTELTRISVFILSSYLVFASIWIWTPRVAAWMQSKGLDPERRALLADPGQGESDAVVAEVQGTDDYV